MVPPPAPGPLPVEALLGPQLPPQTTPGARGVLVRGADCGHEGERQRQDTGNQPGWTVTVLGT